MAQSVKNLPVMQETSLSAGDAGLVPGLGRASGERNGAPGKSPDFVLIGSFGLHLKRTIDDGEGAATAGGRKLLRQYWCG